MIMLTVSEVPTGIRWPRRQEKQTEDTTDSLALPDNLQDRQLIYC